MLDNDAVRVLIYVWGGAHDRAQHTQTQVRANLRCRVADLTLGCEQKQALEQHAHDNQQQHIAQSRRNRCPVQYSQYPLLKG